MTKKAKILTVQNGGCFDDLHIKVDESEVQTKKQKLDIFRLLPELDRRNVDFYSSLDESEKKSYAPLVVMRWMSCTNGDHNYTHHKQLLDVNEYVNIDFWNLTKHPELQHKLLCLAGLGSAQRHQWIPGIKKSKSKSKVDDYLSNFFPKLNATELSIWKKSLSDDDYKSFLHSKGLQDNEVKSKLKDWKEEKKKGM